MRTSEFRQYLRTRINKYSDSPKKSITYIKDVLSVIYVDLEAFGSLKLRELPIQVNYFKHIKRCCLIDLWSVTEIRIRQIAEERGLQVKGRDTEIREFIREAREINRNREVEKYLRKIERKLRGKFVEFPNYLSAILRMSNFSKEETKDWRCFFDIFRMMRNSVHNDFTCTKTCSLSYQGYRKDFVEGTDLKVQFEDLRRIIDRVFEFFKSAESLE